MNAKPTAGAMRAAQRIANTFNCQKCYEEYKIKKGETMKYTIEVECLRCGYHWPPRNNRRPGVCPGCGSTAWDRPRADNEPGPKSVTGKNKRIVRKRRKNPANAWVDINDLPGVGGRVVTGKMKEM